jgi:hypothetical protein
VYFGDRIRLGLRWRWDRVDAELVDSRYVRQAVGHGDNLVSRDIWEYMVDVPGPGGGPPARVTFTERKYKVREKTPGAVVPVLVNPKRTKAMFDLSDLRIDADGWFDEQQRRRKKRDDARFEARRK